MDQFDPALEDLRDTLPSWWAQALDNSELTYLLTVMASFLDELAAQAEGIYLDQTLGTARDDALRREWAVLYGAGSEQLPTTTEQLREYLQARAADDGSSASLENMLLALLRSPGNDTGTHLLFPADGSGLLFPQSGAGLPIFEYIPERGANIAFPADGTILWPGDGTLIFAARGRFEVQAIPADHTFTVRVIEILAFSRPAFARAVNRFRFAHHYPPTVKEVP